MKLLGELLVGVGLDAERLLDGQHLEEEWKFATKAFTYLGRQQSLVVLDHVKKSSLGFNIFGGKRRVCSHPELDKWISSTIQYVSLIVIYFGVRFLGLDGEVGAGSCGRISGGCRLLADLAYDEV